MTVDRTAVRCTWGGGYLPYNFQALLWSIQSSIYNTCRVRGVGGPL
jgi:hypothetical protein